MLDITTPHAQTNAEQTLVVKGDELNARRTRCGR